jgi:arylsulfatase A-like enzyme
VHPNALPYAAGLLDRFFPYVRAMAERADPALLVERADDHLRRLADGARRGTPFFETVFFSAAHFPYAAPYPYYQRFVDPLYAGPFLYEKPPLSPAAVTPVDARHIQALYDGAVSAVDDAVAQLLAELDRSGAAENTIVVLLADHGENLWEDPRAGMGHGDHLVGDKADHVPLLIFDPRHAGQAHDVDSIVRDIDLAPTLAALCGISPLPADGVDLQPLMSGARRDLQLPAFSETEYWFVPSGPGFEPEERLPYPAITGATDLAADGDVFMRPEVEPMVIAAKHRAIRLGEWKLVYRPTRSGVHLSLYDLARDPDERTDVAASFPERFGLLRERLYAWLRDDPNAVSRGDFVVPR